MGVKTFADTSVVKLALQNSNYATYEEWLLTHIDHTNKIDFTTIPYTTESFKASKETKMSTAITGNRRQSGSRNIKGSASGGFTIEASLNSTLLNYLIPAALMNDYESSPVTVYLTNQNHSLYVDSNSAVVGLATSGTQLHVFDPASDGTGTDSKYCQDKATFNAEVVNAVNPSVFYVVAVGTDITAGTQSAVSGKTNAVQFGVASGFSKDDTTASIKFKVYGKRFINGAVATFYAEAIQSFKKVTKDEVKYSLVSTNLPVAIPDVDYSFSVTASVKELNGNSPTSLAVDAHKVKVYYSLNGQEFTKVGGDISVGVTGNVSTTSVMLPVNTASVRLRLYTGTTIVDEQLIPFYSSTLSGFKSITDGEKIKPLLVEKYEKNTVDGTTYHEFSQFFGTCVNELSFEFGAADFVKVSATTMSTDFNLKSSSSSTSDDNYSGSLAESYVPVTQDSLLDTTNSIKSIKLLDVDGNQIQAVFSTASLKITNNLREQSALGYEYMAGIGAGKVNVTLTGEIYFFNNDIFRKHLENEKVSAIIELEDENEVLQIVLPKLTVAAPTNNSQGENQDYKTSLSFNAEEGLADLGDGLTKECVIAMKYFVK